MNSQSFRKQKLPDTPGVYFFVGKNRTVLYIGKATSLKNRVRSYFGEDIGDKRGFAIAQMVNEAKNIKFQKTDSVLEALILEANLIKKYKPKYNVKDKDDKSFNYIIITKEDFPRVLLMRGRELSSGVFLHDSRFTIQASFGPFPRGNILRDALKIIRKIFPFRDTCRPGRGKSCFNAQIGLCPGACSGEIGKKEYNSIIKNLTLFLSGKKKTLIRKLECEMKIAAREKEFERAGEIKKTLFALTHIQDVALIKDADKRRLEDADGADGKTFRIEGYDVAHTSGKSIVGVMVVVGNGEAEKSEYKKFKIKTVRDANDTASLEEILRRRFGHPDWQYPRLIVVDGGKAQKTRAERVLKELGVEIPVVSVVKDEHHRPREILGLAMVLHIKGIPVRVDEKRNLKKDILFANAEAHRFAISYHRKIRGKIIS